MLALADDENATRFEELVNSVTPVISRLLLKLIVDSDALPEWFREYVLVLDQVGKALDHLSLRPVDADITYAARTS